MRKRSAISRQRTAAKKTKEAPLYERIRLILEAARARVVRTVNTTQVAANWLIGREIVEEEQKGRRRATYGKQVLEGLSEKLTYDYGTGYSLQNLRFIRQFYLEYPLLLGDTDIRHALRSESSKGALEHSAIHYAPRSERKIFASRYKLYLPTEAELKTEMRREMRMLGGEGQK